MNYYQNPKFLFGKYRGRSIANVPRNYLEWYLAETESGDKYPAFRVAVVRQLEAWNKLKINTNNRLVINNSIKTTGE